MSLKPVFLSVTTDLLIPPPSSSLLRSIKNYRHHLWNEKETGVFFTMRVTVWILYTPPLNCWERILGQLRSLLARGIVLPLN